MSIKSLVKKILIEKENMRYQKRLADKCISYRQWLAEAAGKEPLKTGNSDEFVVFVASEGSFACGAWSRIADYFRENPAVMLAYGEEDVRGEEWGCPWYKPDWSPDLWKSWFYFGSLVAVRRSFFEKIAEGSPAVEEFAEAEQAAPQVSVYRVTNLEWYRKWLNHCVEAAGGYKKACHTIGHISEILYSCKAETEQQKFLGLCGTESTPGVKGKVSVVIPSKDNPKLLERCLEALTECMKVTGVSAEAIIVDNGSTPENREKIQGLLAHISCEGRLQTDYRYEPMEFNFSAMCNLGAEAAEGDYLLFLNDDVELCMPEVLEQMMVLAAQEYTGAVGVKLRYPDSERIQHAGITNLPMGPVHKLQFLSDNECYYYNFNRGNKNVLAVTAACMMVEKHKFTEAGGFSEELRVAFNDVDLCFSLYELGYHNVCINGVYAYHHESLSRGSDESAEKLNRLMGEREKLYRRHPALEGVDPYYSSGLNCDGLDTRVVPGYVTFRNQTQHCRKMVQVACLDGYRQDECLLVRVEDFRDGRAIGYGVVLGDNNACYDKELLLQVTCSEESNVSAEGLSKETQANESRMAVYGIVLSEQYRQDLEENMPDQCNVALCGYDVTFGEDAIPAGTYRVGMAARNRVTGLKLVNWTNRYVKR